MNYKQSVDYLFNSLPMYQRVGPAAYKVDLGNTLAICHLLGQPQHKFKSVHIAGTNGKGSVSHMLASVLQQAGYRTGLYTSPHLRDFRERIRVDGKMISKTYVAQFVSNYYEVFEKIKPSFFEMTVGLAFDYFDKMGVDIAIIETGLGGRLDSTNVIVPELSVITNIGFDHMALLGDTIQKIAFEKAGIIKKGIPVVIGETQPELMSLFEAKAIENEAPLFVADASYELESYKSSFHSSAISICGIKEKESGRLISLQLPLLGQYQKKNILTVLSALGVLKEKGFNISETHIKEGVLRVAQNTGFKGRWQVLSHKPLVVCDTAHNEPGVKEVMAQIQQITYDKLHIVLGMVNDKDLSPVLDLMPRDATYYFCRPDIPRGLDASALAQEASLHGLNGSVFSSVNEALDMAKSKASTGDFIFVGGSTFVVAEVV